MNALIEYLLCEQLLRGKTDERIEELVHDYMDRLWKKLSEGEIDLLNARSGE